MGSRSVCNILGNKLDFSDFIILQNIASHIPKELFAKLNFNIKQALYPSIHSQIIEMGTSMCDSNDQQSEIPESYDKQIILPEMEHRYRGLETQV